MVEVARTQVNFSIKFDFDGTNTTYRTCTTYGSGVSHSLLRQAQDGLGRLSVQIAFPDSLVLAGRRRLDATLRQKRPELADDDSGGTEAVNGGAHDSASVARSFTHGIKTRDIRTLACLEIAVDSDW